MPVKRDQNFLATHPGIIFKKRVLDCNGITVTEASRKMRVTRQYLSGFVNERGRVTTIMAMRLEKASGISAKFWLNLQQAYDLFTHRDAAIECEPLYAVG